MTNPFKQLRTPELPYAIYMNSLGFEWRVLQTYSMPTNGNVVTDTRWLVAAASDYTFGNFEWGETYASEILPYGKLIAATSKWLEIYGPQSMQPKHVMRFAF